MAGRELVMGPSPRQMSRQDPFTHICIRTKLGAYYTMPDLTAGMVSEMLDHLARGVEHLVVRNISEATLVIPFRIVEAIYRLEVGEDAQIHATSPHGGMGELWVAG